MALIRNGINFLALDNGEEAIVAFRSQFSGVPMIEASETLYFQPQIWGVAKWVSTLVPPDVQSATYESALLYDRATLFPLPVPPDPDLANALVIYVVENARRFGPAIAIWDIVSSP